MRIFVTGATGFIGTELVQELIEAGHQVRGLARSDAGVEQLKAAGVEVQRGDLEDLESLRTGAAGMDVVVNLAFNHDFSKFAQNGADEIEAIQAMGSVLKPGKLLLVTSGIGITAGAPGQLRVETDPAIDLPSVPRKPEQAARAVAERGVHVGIVRLPQVHDTRKQGLVTYLLQIARDKRLLRLHRGRRSPLVRRSAQGCSPPLPARRREDRLRRDHLPRCPGGGHSTAGHRGDPRERPERACGFAPPGKSRGTLRHVRPLRNPGHARCKRLDPQNPGLEPNRSRPHRRPRQHELLARGRIGIKLSCSLTPHRETPRLQPWGSQSSCPEAKPWHPSRPRVDRQNHHPWRERWTSLSSSKTELRTIPGPAFALNPALSRTLESALA